jgi:hypothetical protein
MDNKVSPEEKKYLREFKLKLFELYWEKFGTFFMHLTPHPNLNMGTRGLLKEEKESGLIIVIGPKAIRDVNTDKDYLYAELQFGFKWEKLVVPWDCVYRIYDKGQTSITQMRTFSEELSFQSFKEKQPEKPKAPLESKVIEVDFSKK